jgi:alanine racemase
VELQPAMAWKTRLTQVKPVPAGAFVGYGCTYRTTTDSLIGVLPVGYFEGYDRALSNAAHALVGGRRAPVRGRVCMNMTLVDLTHVPGAAVGDEVVLIGRQGDETITADDLAAWAGTINYEIVARIHPSVPRIPVHGSSASG